MMRTGFASLGLVLLATTITQAQSAKAPSPAAQGRALLDDRCAGCHAIGRTGASPLREAPAMRTIARKYKVENLAEALAEGIVTGHPAMPEFSFEPDQIGAIIAYLKTLQRGR